MGKEIDINELKKNIDEEKILFEKKFKELRTMLKEELGEDNIHYFRISMITELIERDVKEVIDYFSCIKDLEIKMQELCKKANGDKDLPDIDRAIDPVSRIVKDVNSLDDNAKFRLMYYISGYASGKKNKI